MFTTCSDDELSALASEMGLKGHTKESDKNFNDEHDGRMPPLSITVPEPSSTELPEMAPVEAQSCEPQPTKVSKKKKKKPAQQLYTITFVSSNISYASAIVFRDTSNLQNELSDGFVFSNPSESEVSKEPAEVPKEPAEVEKGSEDIEEGRYEATTGEEEEKKKKKKKKKKAQEEEKKSKGPSKGALSKIKKMQAAMEEEKKRREEEALIAQREEEERERARQERVSENVTRANCECESRKDLKGREKKGLNRKKRRESREEKWKENQLLRKSVKLKLNDKPS